LDFGCIREAIEGIARGSGCTGCAFEDGKRLVEGNRLVDGALENRLVDGALLFPNKSVVVEKVVLLCGIVG